MPAGYEKLDHRAERRSWIVYMLDHADATNQVETRSQGRRPADIVVDHQPMSVDQTVLTVLPIN